MLNLNVPKYKITILIILVSDVYIALSRCHRREIVRLTAADEENTFKPD